MPNTTPIADNQTVIEFIIKRARELNLINIFPSGSITKGENGAIEVVLFVATDNKVSGVVIQRHREPAIIAKQLLDPAFLNAFKGLAPTSTFPTFKNKSQQAVSDAIRAMLVEYDAGSRA
jgi:dihydroorotase-like cyclic amidohydrolase